MGTRGVVAILLVLLIGAGVAGIAYNAGVARGLAGSGQISPPPGVAPYPYYGPYWHGPFGFFGFLFPLLFFFLIFALLKGLFWGRHWGGYPGHWGGGVPPMFEEWHRRAHEEKRDTKTA